jgi:hypothetical protein
MDNLLSEMAGSWPTLTPEPGQVISTATSAATIENIDEDIDQVVDEVIDEDTDENTDEDMDYYIHEHVNQDISDATSDTISEASMPVRAPGTVQADPTRLSIANFPYELQAAIFRFAADVPRIIFMEIDNNGAISFHAPEERLGLACQLSREMYLKDRRLYLFGNKFIWIEAPLDIFYLSKYDHYVPNAQRLGGIPLEGEYFEMQIVRNVAVDLQYLTSREDLQRSVMRISDHFRVLRTIHVFVPSGLPPQTAPLAAVPDTLLLSKIPKAHLIVAGGGGTHFWAALKYHIKRACTVIKEERFGINGGFYIKVFGHLTSLLDIPVTDGEDE